MVGWRGKLPQTSWEVAWGQTHTHRLSQQRTTLIGIVTSSWPDRGRPPQGSSVLFCKSVTADSKQPWNVAVLSALSPANAFRPPATIVLQRNIFGQFLSLDRKPTAILRFSTMSTPYSSGVQLVLIPHVSANAVTFAVGSCGRG